MQDSEKQAIHQLWDELTASSAARSLDMLDTVLGKLADLVDAQQAYWLGALRIDAIADTDPAGGWRARHNYYLEHTAEREAVRKEHYRRLESGQVDPSILANIRDAGKFRINIKHEMVPPEWFESEFYQTLFVPFEIQDVIFVATPVSPDVESWMVFERCGKGKVNFGEAERQLLDYAVRPTQWFQKRLTLHHGIYLADDQLTAAERRVLSSLLSDKTEAEIADALGLTANTVHTYCVRICRKFSVRGRNGLISLWLGQEPEPADEEESAL